MPPSRDPSTRTLAVRCMGAKSIPISFSRLWSVMQHRVAKTKICQIAPASLAGTKAATSRESREIVLRYYGIIGSEMPLEQTDVYSLHERLSVLNILRSPISSLTQLSSLLPLLDCHKHTSIDQRTSDSQAPSLTRLSLTTPWHQGLLAATSSHLACSSLADTSLIIGLRHLDLQKADKPSLMRETVNRLPLSCSDASTKDKNVHGLYGCRSCRAFGLQGSSLSRSH